MPTDRRTAWWAACLATALLAGWGVWRIWSASAPASGGPPALPAPVLTATSPETADPARYQGPILDRSVPTKVFIPSIQLRAALDQVGLAPDGTIETPPYERARRAAWYRLGPAPGEAGPAVIVGHVDSKQSVAVFFYLTRVRPGDQIEVVRADKRSAIFTVGSVEEFPKRTFPTNRVYDGTGVPELRLVTCGGRYDAKHHMYLDNIVVFAHLTGVRASM
ncbi:MAG TPA: class F sortase [Micromonosporaceae bacterium]|jgi:hypothetical protein|nr:class F sortase [Micromonosporaceae bacterium]